MLTHQFPLYFQFPSSPRSSPTQLWNWTAGSIFGTTPRASNLIGHHRK